MEALSLLAKKHLSQRAVNPGDAVMFDIDDTLIYSSTGYPIHEMVELLHTSRMLGYEIVIITARSGDLLNMELTTQQLHIFGITPDKIFYTPPDRKDEVKVKTSLNYILSVGDQWTDLGNSEWWIKLPPNGIGNEGFTNMRVN